MDIFNKCKSVFAFYLVFKHLSQNQWLIYHPLPCSQLSHTGDENNHHRPHTENYQFVKKIPWMWRTKARGSIPAKLPWTEEPCGSVFWPDEQDEHKIYLYTLNKDCPELMCLCAQDPTLQGTSPWTSFKSSMRKPSMWLISRLYTDPWREIAEPGLGDG